jgi:hypothetical protein
MRALRSEWFKLTRSNTLFGFGGAMVGLTLLFTALAFLSVGGADVDLDGGESEAFVTAGVLSTSDGSVFASTNLASMLGIVALALFASSMAGEFNKGTIRMLFVAEPNRIKVLAGKLAALALFVAAGVAAAMTASIGIGALLAPSAGVDTSNWWTTEGLTAIGVSYVNIAGAVLVPGLIGAAIAVSHRHICRGRVFHPWRGSDQWFLGYLGSMGPVRGYECPCRRRHRRRGDDGGSRPCHRLCNGGHPRSRLRSRERGDLRGDSGTKGCDQLSAAPLKLTPLRTTGAGRVAPRGQIRRRNS